MDDKEKEYRKLKFGLALKKFMTGEMENFVVGKEKQISFRELESGSGIRHATIVEIVNGKKNPAWSTIDAILEGLEISLTEFASVYDNLTQKEVLDYKKELVKRKQERRKTKTTKK